MNSVDKPYHISVMPHEVLEYLVHNKGTYIDATFGGGGHTRLLLERGVRVIAFDWDQEALDRNGPALEQEFGDQLTLIWGNFAHMERLLEKFKIDNKVDGILADFGTSAYQIAHEDGFSFSVDRPLDMRMSPAHGRTTAADIIARASATELAHIFSQYGGQQHAMQIARAIVQERVYAPITRTVQLATLIKKVLGDHSKTIHPATKVFQALRIVVNRELENIQAFLTIAPRLLNEQGRLACISFHALEDRLVKQCIRDKSSGLCSVTDHVIVPTDEEIKNNPRSRSARLRIAYKDSLKLS
jgi:16S rRNA (cytosine1402-N4)-methyltransferase